METLPCAPEAERDLVGAVLYDELAFDEAALKASDFYIQRFRWIWEACEAIRAADDHIDLGTLEKWLDKAGHLQEAAKHGDLMDYLVPTLDHVIPNARLVREMAERRRMLSRAQALAERAVDLNQPLPLPPVPLKTHWTMEELLKAEFPEPEGPIPGLIPIGLTILCGRPKRGKSFFMLQAGGSLALGGKFLGRDLKPGKVLYYALEDRGKRLQTRCRKLGIDDWALLEFETALKPLDKGGMETIEQAARHGGYSLLVIDTIWRALPSKDLTKDGAKFNDALGQLQSLALDNHLAIAAIVHTRKPFSGSDPDPVDDVLGSTGLTASADMVLAIYTEQGKKGATLKGRGRDLEEVDEALQFDPETCAWESLGDSSEARRMETEVEILTALTDLGKAQSHTVAKMVGKDFSNTNKRLSTLWMAGKIRKEFIEGKPFYFLPPAKEDTEVPTMPITPT